jgi:hypothetical protein
MPIRRPRPAAWPFATLAATFAALAGAAACRSSTDSSAAQPPALGAAQRSPTPAAVEGVVRAEPVARGSTTRGRSPSSPTGACSSPNARGGCAW